MRVAARVPGQTSRMLAVELAAIASNAMMTVVSERS
jgi:hypothetical protein